MTKTTWEIEPVLMADSAEDAVSAVRVHQKFPIPDEDRPKMVALLHGLRRWSDKRQNGGSQREIYLQMTQLPRPGGATLLSRNGSRWMPGLALGVWPDREPPRSMSKEDFTHRLPGTRFPTLAHDARRIHTSDENILLEVEQQMAGSGALLEIVAQEGWAQREGRKVSSWLQQKITDEAYLNYPDYVPLLDAGTLLHLSQSERSTCLAGIDLYLREDVNDQSLVLISRSSLEETLQGIKQASQADS